TNQCIDLCCLVYADLNDHAYIFAMKDCQGLETRHCCRVSAEVRPITGCSSSCFHLFCWQWAW
ncbi:MAG: hypothetical protein ACKPKO_23795, partial [Candidatus Fonsibacter sp.]